jgi:cytochrome P450 family 3 subfamily A
MQLLNLYILFKIFKIKNLPKYDQEIVTKYGWWCFGYFDGSLPNLWITDADVIKSVFVKDFGHFVNRRVRNL